MSSKKHTVNINVTDVLRRVGDIIGSQSNAVIAEALRVEPAVSFNWPDPERNTVAWPVLFNFCQEQKIYFDWLLTERGPKYWGEVYPARKSSQNCDPTCPLANSDKALKKHCKKVKEIIDSKTTYSGALKENIKAFHEAVEEKKKSENDMAALREEMRKEFDDLRSKIANHQKHIDDAVSVPPTGTDEGDGTER